VMASTMRSPEGIDRTWTMIREQAAVRTASRALETRESVSQAWRRSELWDADQRRAMTGCECGGPKSDGDTEPGKRSSRYR